MKVVMPILLIFIIRLGGCRRQQTYGSPGEALLEFPGYLSEANRDSLQVLARREHPLGEVLLYTYGGLRPDEEGLTCVATTFVAEEDERRWRAQSSSKLGCSEEYPHPETIALVYTAGGNITGLATVYGLAPVGETVRVVWQDGLETTAAIENGYVLLSRPETVMPHTIEVLNATGEVIHEQTLP